MRTSLRAYLRPMLTGLLLRLAVMPFTLPEQLDPARDHWRFGYEAGRLARSLAEGHGFANPLFGPTGPSAWMTPAYPALLALIFKVFGTYSVASAVAALSFNALVSALTCIPIALIVRETAGPALAGESRARRAAWAWALFPYAIYFPMERMWETWIATALLAVLILLVVRRDERFTARFWAIYGTLWAAAAYTSPSLCIVLPVCFLYAIHRMFLEQTRGPSRHFAGPIFSVLIFAALLAPWTARNYLIFHRLIPMRDSFATNLRMGNPPEPYFHWVTYNLGPWHNEQEWTEFRTHGELAYMDRLQRLANASIADHPTLFVERTLRRTLLIWTGFWSLGRGYLAEEPLDLPNIPFCTTFSVFTFLGLRRLWRHDRSRAAFLLAVLLVFPSFIVIIAPEVYLRRPLDAVMIALCVFAFPVRGVAVGTEPERAPESVPADA